MKLEQHDETFTHRGASSAAAGEGVALTGFGSTFDPPGVKETVCSGLVVELLYRTLDVPEDPV
jgi:hypothetical protein